MEGMRERTLVGLFVLIAGALLFGTVLEISGGIGGAGVPHSVYFKYAGGIQAGAPVRFGGMTVGKVQRVRVDPGDSTRIEIGITLAKDAPVKVDSVAKITTLGALGDNYIEISTGSREAALAPPASTLKSVEAFGLDQLADAAQTLLPDVQTAVKKLNGNLDELQVTLTRANDLLNDRNRASLGNTLNGVERLVTDIRPKTNDALVKANDTLDNLNGLLTDTRPKVSATLTNVQDLTVKLGPVLDSLKTTINQAGDALAHVDATLMENRADVRASVMELRDTLAQSTTLLAQLNQTLDQNSPNIDDVLENVRMSTENLRALTETLMRSPASLIRGIRVRDRKPGDAPK